MSFEAGLVTYLLADAGLSALIGDRLDPDVLPKGVTLPAMTYQRISTVRSYQLDGPAGRATPRFQFDCYGATKASAVAVANALRAALDGYAGAMGAEVVLASRNDGELDNYERLEGEDPPATYSRSLDFLISHTE